MQKTNFKTRLLALLTAAFMLVMCVPFAAFAEGLSKDDTTKIHVYFQGYQTADGDVYKRGTVTEITAPGDDSIDYWQVDGGVLTVKTGETVSFGQLLTEIGTPFEEGTEKVAFVNFKAVEKKAAAPKRDLKVTFTVDKNLGTFTDSAGAEKVDFTIPEDSQDQYNIPTVEAVDGYKFVGWASEDGTVKWDANTKTFGVSSSWPDEV